MYQLEVKQGDSKRITQFNNYNEAHEDFMRAVNDYRGKAELYAVECTATLLSEGEDGEIYDN